MAEQKHLNFENTVNLGSFYTPPHLVDVVYELLRKNVNNFDDYTIIDTSCGYGSFLRGKSAIGGDVDAFALNQAARNNGNAKLFNYNGLSDVNRGKYQIKKTDKIIIVGNPPYNDTASIIRHDIKKGDCLIDKDLKTRDLGLSFLLSYNKLEAEYICVLHPLSYLIKKANFSILKPFTNNYSLTDSVIVSSGEFPQASKTTRFPIIIALYERCAFGMNYDFIENYLFSTIDGKTWRLNQMNSIDNYITKYPNAEKVPLENAITFFWTMRDINALKRTKTFIDKESGNTVRVTEDKFAYYCYVDIFKSYIKHLPYYFGNCNVFIDEQKFSNVKSYFIQKTGTHYSFLAKYAQEPSLENNAAIDTYFRELIGEHYVD